MKTLESFHLLMHKITSNRPYSLLLIGLLCVAVYARTLDAPFYFDDYSYIVHNPFIQSLSAVFQQNQVPKAGVYEDVINSVASRPLSYFTFAVNYAIHQTSVAGYHVVNIAIHLLNVCLIYSLILLTAALCNAARSRSSQTLPHPHPNPPPEGEGILTTFLPFQGGGQEGDGVSISRSPVNGMVMRLAFFTASLFAVHPVMTNAVTYITQRMASLATLFCLLTIVLYARHRMADSTRARVLWYLSALLSSVAAMKSKETAFALPLLLAVYEGIFCADTFRGRFLKLLPFFLCIPVAFALTPTPDDAGLTIYRGHGQPSTLQVVSYARAFPLEYLITRFTTNPASTAIASMSPLDYLSTQFRVLVTYQRMLLVPVGLNFVHDYPFFRSFAEPVVLMSLLLHLSLLSAAVCLLRFSGKKTEAQGLLYRFTAFGILWFYLSLALESGIIPMDDHFLEHRMYLPAFGFLLAVVSLLLAIEMKWGGYRNYFDSAFIAAIVLFSLLTVVRNEQWRDPLVFWQDALSKSPEKKRIHGYLGNIYRDRGEVVKSLQEYKLSFSGNYPYWQDHFVLGNMFMENRMYQDAVDEYLAALKISHQERSVSARLSEAYMMLGDEKRAKSAMPKALNLEKAVEPQSQKVTK